MATLFLACGGDDGGGGTGPVTPPSDPPVPTTVTVRPERVTLTALGDTVGVAATVTDQYGAAMPAAPVTWRSDDRGVVNAWNTAFQVALFTAVAPGETRVVATAGSASATVAVTVAQAPASVETEGDDLQAFPPGTGVRVSVGVRDRNGHRVSGVETAFRVEEGGGTVVPESVVTDADGLAETTWTLGAEGAQALSVTAGEASARLSVDLCDAIAIILDPGLRLGEPRVFETREVGCGGLSVEAPEAGAYYRFTMVGTGEGEGPNEAVTLSVVASGVSASERRDRRVFASRGFDTVPGTVADPHPGRREHDQRVLSWIARPGGPEPLPDLRGASSARREDPPERRVFTLGSPGTIEDNCTVARSPTGVLLAHNDHIAIYADETLTPPVPPSHAQSIVDMYEDFGVPTIEDYFGGVGDMDGDGRILVYLESLVATRGVTGVVWLGDFLSKEDCPSSNEAELIRFEESWVRPRLLVQAPYAVVHEAKHVSSWHQRILRARAAGQDPWAIASPDWWEEGTAQIASEIFSRRAWETIGGPPPGAKVGASDVAQQHFKTAEAYGIREIMDLYARVVVTQPHSLTASDPYGAGWGFFRFLGDWFGGAGNSRLGDAEMFARLNDASVPAGVDGVQEVVGRTFAELMTDYAQAVSLAGTGAPEVAGVPRFSTYDMTMMNRLPFSTVFLGTGRYPYPVTITGSGPDAQLWLPLTEATTISGLIGRNGVRVHDFRAERAGDQATILVSGPEHMRLVVTRIPDQEGRGG